MHNMKKLVAFAAIAMLGTSAAFAGSLAVPFFLDDGNAPLNGSPFPNTGSATFIALKNNTAQNITVSINYFNSQGVSATPTNNSFILKAGTVLSFRPVANDSTAEATVVPNMTSGTSGSATITWTTVNNANDIQGRLVEYLTGRSHAYLLPPGQ